MPICLVRSCRFSWRKADPNVVLHTFPRDPERIRLWLQLINTPPSELDSLYNTILNDTSKIRICSKHFAPEAYEIRRFNPFLRKDAIPTLELGSPPTTAEEKPPEESRQPQVASELSSAPQVASATGPAIILANPVMISTLSPFGISKGVVVDPMQIFYSPGVATTTSKTVQQQVSTPRPIKKRKIAKESTGHGPENVPKYQNKGIQIDRYFFTRKKGIQVKPARRDVGVNFNGTNLPYLDLFPSTQRQTEERPQEQRAPSSQANAPIHIVVTEFEDSMSAEEDESDIDMLNKSPFMTGRLLSKSKQSFSPEEVDLDDSYGLQEEEEYRTKDTEENDTCLDDKQEDSKAGVAREKKFIVFESCLDSLLYSCRCTASRNCTGKILKIKKNQIGSAISVTAVCSNNHRFLMWTSQPFVGHIPAGDLMVSSGILFGGLDFRKMLSFFKTIGLLFISAATHYANQGKYVYPAVDYYWKKERNGTIAELQGQKVSLVGVGHCDSPRFGAKYCTYSLLERSSQKILDFQVEPLAPGIGSVGLEEKACKMALDRLLKDEVKVGVLCTDRRGGIRKTMRREYDTITHQIDVWHLAKSVGNKLLAASKAKNCQNILPWIAPTKKHLWWAARTCERKPAMLIEKWLSIVHHVANEHRWEEGLLYKACHHPELGRPGEKGREWLKKDSPAYYKFREVVTDPKLIKDLQRLSSFCHAGELEVFRTTAFKYRSKRNRSLVDGTVARMQLAALDYNFNIGRLQAVVKRLNDHSEELEASRLGNGKAKKDWLLSNLYKQTSQEFMVDLLEVVLSIAKGDLDVDWKSQRPTMNIATTAPRRAKS